MADEKNKTVIDIRVKLPEKKREEQKPPAGEDTRNREYPWALRRGENPPSLRLQIEFYDAMTFLKNDGSFDLHEMYVSTDDEINQTFVNPKGKSLTWKHNKLNQPTAAQIEIHYAGDSIPYADKEPLGRMEDSVWDSVGVLPVSVNTPNMEVSLLNTAGDEMDITDYRSYLEGTSQGAVLDFDILTYEWLKPGAVAGDIRVTEKTSAGIVVHGKGNKRLQEGTGWDGSIIKRGVNEILEGIFWNGFDTSDRTNYKITTVPKYDCEEGDVYQDPVFHISGETKIKVFLTRKRCHFWCRYRNSGNADVNYGLFTHWPSDFAMPAPRKKGRWQCTAPYTKEYWDAHILAGNPPYNLFKEENMSVIWTWDGDCAEADGKDYNALYILNIGSSIGIQNSTWTTFRAQDGNEFPFNQRIFNARSGIDNLNSFWHGWPTPSSWNG